MSEKRAKQAPENPENPEAARTEHPEAPGRDEHRGDLPDIEEALPGFADQVAEAVAAGKGEPAAAPDPLAALAAERDELKDRLLRALAETENVRRRAERDRKDAETYGGTRLARDLLSVHDNLERALGHVDEGLRETAKGVIEGVELTKRELVNAFAKHRIEKIIPAVGEKFDPNRHQAMFEAPVPGASPGAVIEVMQAGFTIGDRLLRPALVGVARAAPEAAQSAPTPNSETED